MAKPKLNLIVINEAADQCTQCGGECCKILPGGTLPTEWGANRKEMRTNLVAAFRSGRYCLDWWEGPPSYNYVRPATKGNENKLRDGSWGGHCTFLTPTGCSMTFSQRPFECRDLIPRFSKGVERTCYSGSGKGNKYAIACAWKPYQIFLTNIADELDTA